MNDRAAAIEEFIVTEIATELQPGSLGHDEDLLAAELIDSLGIVTLVGFLEERFGVGIGDDDLTPENFRSVEAIDAFVARKQS